jgi:hypothetical protein
MKIPEDFRDSGFQTGFICGLGCGLFLVFLAVIICVLWWDPGELNEDPNRDAHGSSKKDYRCDPGVALRSSLANSRSLFHVYDGILTASNNAAQYWQSNGYVIDRYLSCQRS